VTKKRQIKDLRTEIRATTADTKAKHEELMNSKQEEMVTSIMHNSALVSFNDSINFGMVLYVGRIARWFL